MELKWRLFIRLRIALKFQSYLYGIEITKSPSQRTTRLVSIVPLWNWNNSANSLWNISKEFQSYLYGIEIKYGYFQLFTLWVSIVPLWNWNETETLKRNTTWSFNRTFMELKFLKAVRAFLTVRGFNRTFMELKFLIICTTKEI